jgi:poly-gamma-glutamate synthesis protein (capsule biosynthesis protein)
MAAPAVPGPLLTLFLCGDVMTGRGVDQVLPHPGDPRLHESYTTSAKAYVELAERAHGRIPAPVDFSYVWGDALDEMDRVRPDARIVNLETSVTRSEDFWPGKGINYRMHPDNAPCLTAARIDCCVLANNHVLDYGYPGLLETLATLERVGVATAGAGRDLGEAGRPAVVGVPGKGRVLVLGFATETSGTPSRWAAAASRPGVDFLADLSTRTLARIRGTVRRVKRPCDLVVASIHWGGNWGFDVPDEHVRFAHGLVSAGVDVVHGHSSHHVRPIEIFAGKLILYGCGDFLDDYEGIGGYEEFRGDARLMYFPTLDVATGRLSVLRMTPMRIRNFRAQRASLADARWLRETIERESRRFRVRVTLDDEDGLRLRAVPSTSAP